MDQWFDKLAKDTARNLSRRQLLGRFASTFALAVLAGFGFRKQGDNCGLLCAQCCRNAYPRGGPELGQCIRECHSGEGLCGPTVCPQTPD